MRQRISIGVPHGPFLKWNRDPSNHKRLALLKTMYVVPYARANSHLSIVNLQFTIINLQSSFANLPS